ncbi:MAG: AzlD domain-containing protein [Chloroflexi bacterium]|nr:MAG: AzlD domain-containing protein [Chloroflexota bacterium]MBL1194784.1 AzlD domain-containing protein [Chloroflexota bacterium]NOH12076.1 AzlD domain-containing protein [Chloroflexota bacterium]
MNEWLTIFGMMLVTFGVRYPVLALVGKIPLPDPIFRSLKYVPPAVLTAIIVPEILLTDGRIDLAFNNAPLFAGILAGLVAWRSKNLLLTIVLGMLALWGWTWLIS